MSARSVEGQCCLDVQHGGFTQVLQQQECLTQVLGKASKPFSMGVKIATVAHKRRINLCLLAPALDVRIPVASPNVR